MPPRHGKSELCSQYFPAWYLGRNPDHRVMLASYESTFAELWGEKTREVLTAYGPSIFGVGVHTKRTAANDWRLEGRLGRMMCAGADAGFTGRGANLLIIDDPVKNAADAQSERKRQKAWDWWVSTARTRLEPDAVVVIIMTRWHQDDLVGRIIEQAQREKTSEQWEVLSLPALATMDGDAIGRSMGEALWPWRFTRENLESLRVSLSAHWWEALYQQRPVPPGGSLAKASWFKPVSTLPDWPMQRCRFWDCAGTEEEHGADPDWTVGALVARDGGKYFIEEVIRVRESTGEVDKLIAATARRDGQSVMIREEQEPGSSGKAVINARRISLAGYDYDGKLATGAKSLRWQLMLNLAEVGNVGMKIGDWNGAFLAEVVSAPYGAHDDQLDAVAGAVNAIHLEVPMASLESGAAYPLYH